MSDTIYIYIYIYREREREIERWFGIKSNSMRNKEEDIENLINIFWYKGLYNQNDSDDAILIANSYYYMKFQMNTLGKGMNPLIIPTMG